MAMHPACGFAFMVGKAGTSVLELLTKVAPLFMEIGNRVNEWPTRHPAVHVTAIYNRRLKFGF